MVLDDVSSNSKISKLLPLYVSFVRSGIQRTGSRSVLLRRFLRFISALFSNPYLNFSPKPYVRRKMLILLITLSALQLSHLVTGLLSSLIPDRPGCGRDGPQQQQQNGGSPNGQVPHSGPSADTMDEALEHVPLASAVLRDVLERWATPVNQLRYQTHRALADCLRDTSLAYPFSQLGALSAITALGPEVLDEYLLPMLHAFADALEEKTILHAEEGVRREGRRRVLNRLRGTLIVALQSVLYRHCASGGEELTDNFVNDYSKMMDVYGDSLCLAPLPLVGRVSDPPSSLGVGRLRFKPFPSENGAPSTNDGAKMTNGPSTSSPSKRRRKEDYRNFDDFLEMSSLPNDIFEEASSEGDRRKSDGSSTADARTRHVPAQPRRPVMAVNVPGCEPVAVERLRQRGFSLRAAYEEGRRPRRAPVLIGGRVGRAVKATYAYRAALSYSTQTVL